MKQKNHFYHIKKKYNNMFREMKIKIGEISFQGEKLKYLFRVFPSSAKTLMSTDAKNPNPGLYTKKNPNL